MDKMFLATTALSNFWDKSSPVLFLGEWCLRYDRRKEWENLDHSLLPYPFDDRDRMEQAVLYCEKAYEDLLHALRESLNDIHSVSWSDRYWRILVGPWLQHYVQILYERYICLQSALESHNVLSTIALSEDSFTTPYDFDAFMFSVSSDICNLQLYSQILGILNPSIISHKSKLQKADSPLPLPKRGGVKSALKYVISKMNLRAYLRRSKVWYFNSHIPLYDHIKIMARSAGRAMPVNFGLISPSSGSAAVRTDTLRMKLGQLSTGRDDPFLKILIKTLPTNFPLLYLEGYRPFLEKLASLLNSSPRALVVETSDYSGACLFLSAELQERKKTRLIYVQHGGSYGTVKHSPPEKHEQCVSNEYWSWGWEEGLGKRAHPMPSFIVRQGKNNKDKREPDGRRILYCANDIARYHYRFWSNPIGPQWKEVIDWQHRWLRALSHAARSQLLVRLYPNNDYGWSQRERLMSQGFSDLSFDTPGRSFKNSLDESSLFVTDTNHTTFLQALALDKPTIIFWDPALNELRKSAEPYFEGLRSAGILHITPESAGQKVNAVCGDPLSWWKSKEVKSTADAFREQFARTSQNVGDIWSQNLQRLMSSPSLPIAETAT